MKYNIVVCGGTFDHFHKGHREFLRFGLSVGNRVFLGLTTDRLIVDKDSNSGNIEDYETRKKQVEDFLTKEKAIERVAIEPIDDVYIPKVWDSLPIEAIIVSKNTISGAKRVNLKRQEQKKYPLVIEVVPLVKNANNEYISSSKIRNGEMNREGKPYLNPVWLEHDLKITKSLRGELKKPFGELIKASAEDLGSATLDNILHKDTPSRRSILVITVGDVATKTFNKLGFKQDISVIDFCVARKKVFFDIRELGFLGKERTSRIINPAGYLTQSLFLAVINIFKQQKVVDKDTPSRRSILAKKVILKIEGEEDLTVLPLILVSPLNSIIFYGQPNEGMVKVEVSEDRKKKAYQIVSKFSVCISGH